ncbi:hypothetical protein [Thiomicrorhabdus sp.]|uniref:hypothetical protein n=1 Tax=Thiomicrorhabdus sp. TaxID=2039724 RepID=UPI0035668BE1
MGDSNPTSQTKESVEIRIELVFKPRLSKSFKRNPTLPIQGQPLDLYIKIKNISNHVFTGAKLTFSNFEHRASQSNNTIRKNITLPSLNPNQTEEVFLDGITFALDGGYWYSMKLSPAATNQDIVTHQFDPYHGTDEKYGTNEWGEIIYVEGKLATLQSRTNHYILILTAITVWEAIFGIGDSLKWFAQNLSILFLYLSNLFEYISS